MSLLDLLPIPQLRDAKQVLCIQPHPDDIDISCGGTIRVLASEGAQITYVSVTDGSAGSVLRRDEQELAAVRQNEQEAAGAFLGVRNYEWLNYRDADQLSSDALQADIIRQIRIHQPDTVITLDPWLSYEAHPAHRTVGLCTAAAVLLSGLGNICTDQLDEGLTPHTVSRIAFSFTSRPNTWVDVSQHWEQKLKAVRAHQSQFSDDVWPFYAKFLEEKGKQYGEHLGCNYAEALKVFTPMHLHCNVDAQSL